MDSLCKKNYVFNGQLKVLVVYARLFWYFIFICCHLLICYTDYCIGNKLLQLKLCNYVGLPILYKFQLSRLIFLAISFI